MRNPSHPYRAKTFRYPEVAAAQGELGAVRGARRRQEGHVWD